MRLLHYLFLILILISCENKSLDSKPVDKQPELIKVGYYPTFHQNAEIIVNLKENYITFYNPNSYILEPPNPIDSSLSQNIQIEFNNNYKNYLAENPKLEPFYAQLSQEENQEILKKISELKETKEDEKQWSFDGMSTNIFIVYSDKTVLSITPTNIPNNSEYELYSTILDLAKKHTSSKNDLKIIKEIQGYE